MAEAGRSSWRSLPRGIWALGFVSLFMDISSELIHSLLPLFMVTTLGASMLTVGIVEGIAEASAAVMKVFSGLISDRLRRRKPLVLLGYGLAALSKPLFPLASSIAWVFAARFADRLGKGIRGAPRDALIADLTPRGLRGAAYGLRQALDSLGALLGPLLAMALLLWFTPDLRSAMWIAVVPALIAVALLFFTVHETTHEAGSVSSPIRLSDAGRLPLRYWLVVILGALFTLARFSEAFLLLRAEDVGVGLSYVPLVMVVMNLCYAGVAYPAGAAADRMSQRWLILLGLGLLIAADLILALAPTISGVFIGAALWGLHMALTQGLLSKLVADTAPAALLGTGFGLFHLVSGGALLLASLIAGGLWNSFGAPVTFLAGALFAGSAAIGLLLAMRHGGAKGG